MKPWLLWASSLAVLGVINGMVVQKERQVRSGTPLYLELAPVDPRSLMQGDYMFLDYALTRGIPTPVSEAWPADGCLIVARDPRGVGRFVRHDSGEPLSGGELRLRYRRRGRIRLGAESFLFQEGDAPIYQRARFSELRVTPAGESVLVGLLDEDLKPLGR